MVWLVVVVVVVLTCLQPEVGVTAGPVLVVEVEADSLEATWTLTRIRVSVLHKWETLCFYYESTRSKKHAFSHERRRKVRVVWRKDMLAEAEDRLRLVVSGWCLVVVLDEKEAVYDEDDDDEFLRDQELV
jgi:hypothetical protein